MVTSKITSLKVIELRTTLSTGNLPNAKPTALTILNDEVHQLKSRLPSTNVNNYRYHTDDLFKTFAVPRNRKDRLSSPNIDDESKLTNNDRITCTK